MVRPTEGVKLRLLKFWQLFWLRRVLAKTVEPSAEATSVPTLPDTPEAVFQLSPAFGLQRTPELATLRQMLLPACTSDWMPLLSPGGVTCV